MQKRLSNSRKLAVGAFAAVMLGATVNAGIDTMMHLDAIIPSENSAPMLKEIQKNVADSAIGSFYTTTVFELNGERSPAHLTSAAIGLAALTAAAALSGRKRRIAQPSTPK